MDKKYVALGAGAGIGAVVAWKFLTRPSEVVWEDAKKYVANSEYSKFIEVDGATVHYQEFGDETDPTLVLVHGFSSSTAVWQTVAPMFAERGFHVVAVDLLGFGYSDKPDSFDYTIASQARMIVRFMNLLGIGRATLVGSSYGGAVCSAIALDDSQRVEKLVLVGSVCNDEALAHPALKLAGIPGVGEILSPFLIDSKPFMKIRMKGTLAPANHDLITKERIESVLRPLRAKDAHHSVLETARNWDACRIERDAHLINQPTLIIWGEEDFVIPIHNAYSLHEKILNSRFVVFRNCGHVPPEESPKNFVEVTTNFCKNAKGRFEFEENEQMRMENIV